MRKINGIEINAIGFAYDGCHKIYLLNNGDDIVEAEDNGYDVFDIDGIVSAFIYSCPLRFINEWGGDFKSIISQAENNIVFEGFKVPDDLDSMDYEIVIENNKCILKSFSEN